MDAIASPKPAAGLLHSLRLCPRLVQAPAAGSPHTLPVGPHFAQGPTTDSPRRVFVLQCYNQLPATASPHGFPVGHFFDQDPAAASPHVIPTRHRFVQDLAVDSPCNASVGRIYSCDHMSESHSSYEKAAVVTDAPSSLVSKPLVVSQSSTSGVSVSTSPRAS